MSVSAARRLAVVSTVVVFLLIAVAVLQRQLFSDARGSFDGLTLVPMLIVLAAVGGLIAARRPDNSYGWVLLAVAATWTINAVTIDYAALALSRDLPGASPAAATAVSTGGLAWGMFVTFVLLLYPTGTLPSKRWRWIGRLAAAGLFCMCVGLTWSALKTGPADVVAQFLSGASVEESGLAKILNEFGHLGVFASMIAGVVALFARRRGAGPIERLQLKWFAWGAGVVAGSILFFPLLGDFAWLEIAAITAMPIVIGIAITRWHLYDIDRIVSRTLAYALLTVLLVGIYLAAVTALTALTAPVTGQSPIAVAAATLLAAAAFQPARRRIQSAVDRRFNRARYDARRTVEDFAATLRQEVDLDDVRTHLLATIDDVLEPREITVWVRPRAVQP